MRTSIDIPGSLMRRAKALARRRGSTLRDLVLEGLRRLVDEPDPAHVPFRLRDCAFKGGDGPTQEFADGEWERVRDAIYEGRGG
jgi:hypothetical protein